MIQISEEENEDNLSKFLQDLKVNNNINKHQ